MLQNSCAVGFVVTFWKRCARDRYEELSERLTRNAKTVTKCLFLKPSLRFQVSLFDN